MTVTSGTFTQTPVTTPPPTASTYTFTQTGYSAWQSTAAANGLSNTITSTGWGQRTGTSTAATLALGYQPLPDSYGGYYTSNSTGSRTLTHGALLGNGSGTSFGTLTGTVTGVPGSTLTGTGTYTGTSAYGETTSYSGTVTIDATGRLTFTYANGTISSLSRLLSASGTITETPGTYFTQTMEGARLSTSSSSDGYSTASFSSIGTGGSRTGVLPGNFGLSVTGTETSPWPLSYLPNEMGNLNGTMQGVVSGTPGSTLTGAMTIVPSNQDSGYPSNLVSSLKPGLYLFPRTEINDTIVSSINIQPNGAATGTGYDTYFQDGKFATTTFNLTQTPSTSGAYTPINATYNFNQTYNGALMVNNNMSLVSGGDASTNGFGWGLRSGTGTTGGISGGAVLNYNGYFGAYDKGVWNGAGSALLNYSGSSLTTAVTGPGSVTQMSGSVSGNLGNTLTGTMTWVGSLMNGPSFSYSGPVSMSSDGSLHFTYGNGTYANGSSYSSNWTMGALNGTASGTLDEYQGFKFHQTMTADYQVNISSPYNGSFTVSNSSTTTGSRSGVYGGNTGPFSGTFNLWASSPNALPTSLSGLSGTGVTLTLDGVTGNSKLGAAFGSASLLISTTDYPSLMTIPGTVGLSPGNAGSPGGTYFTAPGVLVQNASGTPFSVGSFTSSSTLPTPLAQTPLYYFSESYQGFRLSTLGASPNLANIEGYGFGIRTSGTNPAGTTALPTNNASLGYNYLGAFLAQDLGTRASATPLSSNMLGLTGTLSATLSGTLGTTLTGQGLFKGTNSAGVAFSYQGNVSLAANGQLVFNYGGTWNNATQTGTGSGMIQQIPGTYFTETVTGTYQQASTSTPLAGTNYPTGTNLSVVTIKDAAPLTGTRIVGNTTSTTTGSYAGMLATVTPPPSGPSTGSGSATVQGVVAGPSYQTQWGVATISTTAGGSSPSAPTAGTVTIDPSGTLTGQFINTQASGTSTANPANNFTQNYVSVPTASGLTTASYSQTASGTFNAGAYNSNNNTQSVIIVTTPTPLVGTSSGIPSPSINANLNITSTALQPGAYASGAGTISTTAVGVVAGPVAGTQTGVSTVQAVKTTSTGTTTPTAYVGATTLKPSVPGSTPTAPVMTTTLQGVNPATVPAVGTVGASQTGILTVTPK